MHKVSFLWLSFCCLWRSLRCLHGHQNTDSSVFVSMLKVASSQIIDRWVCPYYVTPAVLCTQPTPLRFLPEPDLSAERTKMDETLN